MDIENNNNNNNNNNNHFHIIELLRRNSFLEFLLEAIKDKLSIFKKEKEDLEKKIKKCSICLEKESDYIFIPCGHYCMCNDCKNKWINFNNNNSNNSNNNNLYMCPMCREVGNIYKVF
jgi:hypothetical protein